MKKFLLTIAAAVMSIMAIAQDQAPAFPGAEGHGRYVTGGRGKTVVQRISTTLVQGRSVVPYLAATVSLYLM